MYSLILLIPITLCIGFIIAFKKSENHFDNSDLR